MELCFQVHPEKKRLLIFSLNLSHSTMAANSILAAIAFAQDKSGKF